LFFIFYFFLFLSSYIFFFFFNDTATTEIYTLSLHDALPISTSPSFPTCSRATRINSRCPRCKAPIVGTRIDLVFLCRTYACAASFDSITLIRQHLTKERLFTNASPARTCLRDKQDALFFYTALPVNGPVD